MSFLPTDSAPEWWPTDQALLTREPFTRWRIGGAGFPGDRYSSLALATADRPDTGAALLDGLLQLPELDYGLVHAWHDAEAGGDPAGLREDHGRRWLMLTPRDLAARLPTLFWAQVLGPPWVDLFGRDVIASTPAHRVEELPGGDWLVQLSERLTDVIDDHDRFVGVRRACIAHLGADCFYSAAQGPSGRYRAAVIPTLAERE